MLTKGDLINRAYAKGRISGLTSQPTPEDIQIGLEELEDMAAQWEGLNICTGYNFEDTPDVNSVHNLQRKHHKAYISNLAVWLLINFGKQPMQSLVTEQTSSFSFISANTATPRPVRYPSRMPIGSGNNIRNNRLRRFYPNVAEPPNDCATNDMIIADVADYVEHFDAYLNLNEDIASYTLEADEGLTVVSQSLSTPDVNYRIQADGNNDTSLNQWMQVKIIVTTTDGRVETRIINFSLTAVD